MECNGWMHGCMNEFEKSNRQGGQALNEPVELEKMINSPFQMFLRQPRNWQQKQNRYSSLCLVQKACQIWAD